MQQSTIKTWFKQHFHFQFGIRKRMRMDMIVVGTMFAITLLLSPLIGAANCASSTMGVVIVFLSTWNDYTLEPVKNLCKLTAGTLGVIFAAFLGYALFPPNTLAYTILMTSVTFVTFFVIIQLFTSELKGNFFMPLLLNFSVMLFQPVYGRELIIRVGLDLLIIGIVIFFQIVLFKNKFRKKIHSDLDALLQQMKVQATAIMTFDHPEQLLENSQTITKNLQDLQKTIGPRLAQVNRWQAGHDVMRTLHILHRINNIMTDHFIAKQEPMSRELYLLLEGLFEAIDQFEQDQIPEKVVYQKFDLLFTQLNTGISSRTIADDLQTEADDFLEEEVEHTVSQREDLTLWERLFEHFNLHTIIFGLKTASIAALGVWVTCFFQLENASMYVMTVSVLAMPYAEVGKKKIKLRILHTGYALAMFIIAFSVPGGMWVHILLLLGMIIFGDMAFQFETNVIGSTMMVVVIRTIQDPEIIWELTAYRIIYVVSAALLILLVDMLIFPNRIQHSLQKRLQGSLEITKMMRAALYRKTTTTAEIRQLVLQKRRANQKLRHVNQFAQNATISTYLLTEDMWLNRLTLLMRRLQLAELEFRDLQQFVDTLAVSEQNMDPFLTPRQKSILISLRETAGELTEAEQIAATAFV